MSYTRYLIVHREWEKEFPLVASEVTSLTKHILQKKYLRHSDSILVGP